MQASVVLAVNPAAAGLRRIDLQRTVVGPLERDGHRVTVLRERDAAALGRAVAAAVAVGPDAVVVVGGDGSVNLVVNELAGSATPIGIVPGGTGNDLARGLGLPHADPNAAVARIRSALAGPAPAARTIDLVHVGRGRWFAGVLSAGFDAAVNERANRMRRPRGRSRYVVALLRELARLRPRRYRITIDRDPRPVDAVLVTVGNTTTIGGGMRITPDAVPDDGLLDVLIATPLTRRQLLAVFPRVFRGTHVRDLRVTVERGRVVTLAVDDLLPPPVAYADGEWVGHLPLTLELVPGALRVLGG